MIHDEKTTEIELPVKKSKKDENIVRVKFSEKRTQPIAKKNPVKSATLSVPSSSARLVVNWLKELDIHSPWIIRLLAVLSILILSMLVL